MGLEVDNSSSSGMESVIVVVMDVNRNKGRVDALEWALKHVVCQKDTVIALGVLCQIGKKSSACFPLNMGIGLSGIWEKLEFSSQGGQGEERPRKLGEEIERKKERYQRNIQPFYKQCKRNEVKLEIKLAVGFCPQKITVEQAQHSNPRWIVLDSHLKKCKSSIYHQVRCNIAVLKGKDVATLMASKSPLSWTQMPSTTDKCHNVQTTTLQESPRETSSTVQEEQQPAAPTPNWYPLSWRTGFPRSFSQTELDVITNGFSAEINLCDEFNNNNVKVYQGMLQDTPVLIRSFSEDDERFWTVLKILSRVRHRNLMNLVGYCCTGTDKYLLSDFPYRGTLEHNLQCDDLARKLSWKARWYIALEIGGCLRYLHEECTDGAIAHLSVCSSHVVFSRGCTTMLGNFTTARLLKDDSPGNEDSESGFPNLEKDECLSTDIRGYGLLLIELITGKSCRLFRDQCDGEEKSLIDQTLPLIEKGQTSEVLDPRLMMDSRDPRVDQMADAALVCLNNDLISKRFSISEVLAVVRGDQLAMAKC